MAGSFAGWDASAGGDAEEPGAGGTDRVESGTGGQVDGGSGGSAPSGGKGGVESSTGGQVDGGSGGSAPSGGKGGVQSSAGGQVDGGSGGSAPSGGKGGVESSAGGQVDGGSGGSAPSGGTGGVESTSGQVDGGASEGGSTEAGGTGGQTGGGVGGQGGGEAGAVGGPGCVAGQPCPGECEPCSSGRCDTVSEDACSLGIWPNGVIYWDWDPAHPDQDVEFKQLATRAMDDWEHVTGVVQFVYSTAQIPRVHVWAGANAGDSSGYDACLVDPDSCHAWFHATLKDGTATSDDVYHELGHVIGLSDHYRRADRNKYLSLCSSAFNGCGIPAEYDESPNGAACNDPTLSVFGPFDFRSAMHLQAAHPAITRWDGRFFIPEIYVPEDDSCLRPPDPTRLPLPEQCTDGDCTVFGSNCIAPSGSSGSPVCPTCPGCQKGQPMGFPTKGDAAAVVELYATQWAWQPFVRTVADDGAEQPVDFMLASGVQIQANSNPALATWDDGTLRLYVLGADGKIYEKQKSTTAWQPWAALGGTQIFDSSPSAVSWGSGRVDVVVRGSDGNVYVKTSVADMWTDWQSLGEPSEGASSAPAITSWGPDRLDVFVRGGDGRLWVNSCSKDCEGNTGTWTDWSEPFGPETFRGVPAPVSRGVGMIDLFVHGTDDTIWGTSYDAGEAGDWYLVLPEVVGHNPSYEDCYSPAATSRGAQMIDIVVRGTDDQLWMANWVDEWGEWLPYYRLGGVLKSAPATVSRARASDRVDVVAIMEEEREAGAWQRGVWWKAWRTY
ncbi:MAG: hypothetical protein JW940_25840 [Polyangiaceae bacterium]|nr:hypothetical protein [Polyangiaceae bacterium]